MPDELSELEKDILRYASTLLKHSAGGAILRPTQHIVDTLQKQQRATPEETRRLIDGLCEKGLIKKLYQDCVEMLYVLPSPKKD